MNLRIVFLGLSITSSWGNGHATTYRGLVRELDRRGHDVLFLERDVPYYASQRDLPQPPFGRTALYRDLAQLRERHARDVANADAVIVGSYVPQGVAVADWVLRTARGSVLFYDIDTPVTLAKLSQNDHAYLEPQLIPRFDAYLSFTGGPVLEHLRKRWGARRAWPLHCSADPGQYHPEDVEPDVDLGYLGTYSLDRQPTLEALLIEPARQWRDGRFMVAGPQYPPEVAWPANVRRHEHLPPDEHRAFYNRQRFTLNVTRSDMIAWGHSPSVRLFEAAACGTPIVSDWWAGLDSFFLLDTEILVAATPGEMLRHLRHTNEEDWRRIGERARRRVLDAHTAKHRAIELELHIQRLARETARVG